MIEVKVGDVIVSSADSQAQKEIAETFALVLSRNWLEDHPETEPLYLTAQFEDHEVIYVARIERIQ